MPDPRRAKDDPLSQKQIIYRKRPPLKIDHFLIWLPTGKLLHPQGKISLAAIRPTSRPSIKMGTSSSSP